MCPHGIMKREIGFMEFSLFKKIIKQIKGSDNLLWLHQFGESLFHPELELFINYCTVNKIGIAISTNATVLDDDKSRMLLRSSVQRLVLCIDGHTKDTYEKLRLGGDYEKTKENVLNFLRIAKDYKRKDLLVQVQIIKIPGVVNEIEAFKKEWNVAGAHTFVKYCELWGNQTETIAKPFTVEPSCPSLNKKRYPCKELWYRGGVQWNGDFIVCCLDYNGESVAGNFSRDSLKEIWNSPAMLKLRREHIENNYSHPLCKKCTQWCGCEKDIYYPFSKIPVVIKRKLADFLKKKYLKMDNKRDKTKNEAKEPPQSKIAI